VSYYADHELKTWCAPFNAVWHEHKRFEIRRNDRAFKVGDVLRLREWDHESERYTGRSVDTEVTYIVPGGNWGLPDDLCVMSIRTVTRTVDYGVLGQSPTHRAAQGKGE
jgi:hypothetical protein